MENNCDSTATKMTLVEGLPGAAGPDGKHGRDGRENYTIIPEAPLVLTEHDGVYALGIDMQAFTEALGRTCPGVVPPAGTHLGWSCDGMTRLEIVANGQGGQALGQVIENSPDCGYVQPPAGAHLAWECHGATRVEIVADGAGGKTIGQVITDSPDCTACPPAGQHLSWSCSGTTRVQLVTDGNCGVAVGQIVANSTECGGVVCPPDGTHVSWQCSGTTRVELVADGNCGTRTGQSIPNSPDCGFVPCPEAGTVIGTTCSGTTRVDTVANGSCGTYQVQYANAPECGYVPCPAQGTVISSNCDGFTLTRVIADGNCGTTTTTVQNSTECGYMGNPPEARFLINGSNLMLSGWGMDMQLSRNLVLAYDDVAKTATITGFGHDTTGWGGNQIFIGTTSSMAIGDTVMGAKILGPLALHCCVISSDNEASTRISDTINPANGTSLIGLVFTNVTQPITTGSLPSSSIGLSVVGAAVCQNCGGGGA